VIRRLELRDDHVLIRSSPAASVTLVVGRRRGARASVDETDDTGLITSVRLERPPSTAFGRVEVADPLGRRVWTNPLWLEPRA
jgi:hypothetical protein